MFTTSQNSAEPDFPALLKDPVNRRAFLLRMAAAGLGLAAAGLLASSPEAAQASGSMFVNIVNVPDNKNLPGIPGRSNDERILNYALALETLEADLYRQALNAAAGKPIDTPLADDLSGYKLSVPTTGVPHPDLAFQYLQQFAPVEAAHRDFLRAAIQAGGGTPISPNPGGYKAPLGNDLRSLLVLIRTVEETGVRAYLGAASFIIDHKTKQTAASIYSTEARHSAAINYAMGLDVGPSKQRIDSSAVYFQRGDKNFEFWMTPEQILARVKPFFV